LTRQQFQGGPEVTHFEEELGIDPEGIEYSIPQLPEQGERVPSNWKANPFYSRLNTVGDHFHFISAPSLKPSA
jgi:hypothetical protein